MNVSVPLLDAELDAVPDFLNELLLKVVREVLVGIFVVNFGLHQLSRTFRRLLRLGFFSLFLDLLSMVNQVVSLQVHHFLDAQQDLDRPVLAWLPNWKVKI